MANKKNPEVDNERLRLPLMFLGFFIIGSLITLSFSYKHTVEYAGGDKDGQAIQDIPVQEEVVEDEKEEPEVQEVQDMDVQMEVDDNIQEVKSDDKDEKIDIVLEKIIDEPDVPAPPAPIVDYPDVEAGFPGGAAAMKQFLADNIKYPEIAMELGDQGRVFIEFVVNKDGTIEQVKVLRGVSKEIDLEAQRVVRRMPKWKPAEANGEAVRARCRIPINFILH